MGSSRGKRGRGARVNIQRGRARGGLKGCGSRDSSCHESVLGGGQTVRVYCLIRSDPMCGEVMSCFRATVDSCFCMDGFEARLGWDHAASHPSALCEPFQSLVAVDGGREVPG